ncbi:MAG: class I SAM-dependent methyltransferase [Acidilobaceae archaeon]|nr:class I SAM-dependent methyltransferase [Acidilobaceae archaeon]
MSLVKELLEESRALGISHISIEDGLVLMAEAFTTSSLGGRVFVDAGAGVGFSALWILAGISDCEGCLLIAIEYERERHEKLRRNLDKVVKELGAKASAEAVRGNALEVVGALEALDYVFVDIEKPDYPKMLSILEARLRPLGVALFHNAIQPRPPEEFFEMAMSGPWRSIIIPTGPGLMLVRKR